MNTTCLNSIYCCICIYIYKCRCTKDLAILIAICSIQHEEDCRRHHFTFHVETAFLTIRIRIWLHSVLWRVVPSPDGPCSIGTGCWIKIWLVTLDALNLVKIGYSTRRTFYIILFYSINSTLTSFRWNPNFRPRVMQSLFIRWHTPVTLSALVLYMVAAYVCGTAVYTSGVRCTGTLIPLLLDATG